jgi:hypothetical protein
VPQEEVAQALAGAVAVFPCIVAGAQQVASRLFLVGGHPHRGQLARPQEPRQLARVAALGLDPLPGDVGGR